MNVVMKEVKIGSGRQEWKEGPKGGVGDKRGKIDRRGSGIQDGKE